MKPTELTTLATELQNIFKGKALSKELVLSYKDASLDAAALLKASHALFTEQEKAKKAYLDKLVIF